MLGKLFQKVSQAPTHPRPAAAPRRFDVAELYEGPASLAEAPDPRALPLDEKLRRAYFWIVNSAILSPHYDLEFHDGPAPEFLLGDRKARLVLPSDQSYSSYVLLPLLTFATQRKCLFIGGPGRGKTASAILMGVLAGYSVKDVRRGMQRGHPQLTVADLVGSPLPKDLIGADQVDQVRIAWRQWLSMRVKIVDEYNRIPTRTQSALLTLMGDNYVELYDQVYECPPAAWYLTANDDAGGGTYQVIEALRDRIDVIVQALPFNPRYLGELLTRIEENARPEEFVPAEIVFTAAEIERMGAEIRRLPVPRPVLRRLEHFASQFEFSDVAGEQFEYKAKDTARLAGTDWAQLTAQDDGRDRLKDLGCQTVNGLSVRNLLTLLSYAKAMAWFRGEPEVTLADVTQVLPFVLCDKLKPDLDAPHFAAAERFAQRSDRIGWLRQLFLSSCQEYDRQGLDRQDPVGTLLEQIRPGLEGVSEAEVRKRLAQIERLIAELGRGGKLYGPLHDDLLVLKSLHQRHRNYLSWLLSGSA